MAFTSDHPNLLSTQQVIEAVDEKERGPNDKASQTSTMSLSSSTSKEGVTSNSRKAEGRKLGGRKRKASVRTSPYAQAAVPSSPPPVVRRLSADKSHFKDIVHQFTGLPTPPPPPPRWPFLAPPNSDFLAAAISKSLQTLDTISAYLLLHGSSQENNILLNAINKSKSLTFLQALKQQDSLHQGSLSTFNPLSAMGTHNSSSTIGGVDSKSSCPCTSKFSGVDSKSSCPCTSKFSGVDFKSLFASHIQSPPNDINMGMLGSQELPPTNMHKSQLIAELESVLLKDNNMSHNFFSLAWVLLKQMASQPTTLAL